MITSDDGVFSAATVVPAAGYSLKVTRQAFQGWQSESFEVAAGQTVNFKIPLEAADTAPRAQAGAAPLQEPDMNKAGTSEQVTALEVELLPATARRLYELIPLAPTVTTAESRPGLMVTRGLPFSNAILTDGIDVTNHYSVQEPALGRPLSQDAVQDFQVLASDGPAAYGRAMGGIVDAQRHDRISRHRVRVFPPARPGVARRLCGRL